MFPFQSDSFQFSPYDAQYMHLFHFVFIRFCLSVAQKVHLMDHMLVYGCVKAAQ